ncbi:hypothetical protein [Phascolarctobacterium sp.]
MKGEVNKTNPKRFSVPEQFEGIWSLLLFGIGVASGSLLFIF